MTGVKIAPIELTIDATEVTEHFSAIHGLFKLPPAAFEGVPEHVIDLFLNYIFSLLNNIVLSDFSTTFGTTNANEISVKVKIIGPLEHLTAAIRAGNLQGLIFEHRKILPSVGGYSD
ncbi:hypothetical protein BVY32_RS17420 [Escherichia coli]|uniref:hypothetical protein n=1 Tax=Bacteria TaxID=2 RepID=UPI0003C5DB1B|nr:MULTISPECIES: hypothetical protein [Bacteria]EST61356.1 regulatory protein [Escherichia coli ECC-Z]KHH16303.1 hypothetical protein PU63_19435 [Escherichia coli]KIG42598.1 hypothetical protein PU64_14370 [Escherichia coli]MCD9167991.1 hypothetical protein [Escherichia coli]MCO0442912.1 hypothetical protein [Escherichia coli]